MSKHTTTVPFLTIGLDVGDRTTHYCVLDSSRQVTARGRFPTRRQTMLDVLSQYVGGRVILEAGSQSAWMSAALREVGFPVQVVDPRRVALIAKDPRKTDRRDAETLARLGSGVPELLGEVHHRDERTQADLSVLRARDLVVRSRTKVIQQVRGLVKSFGLRLPGTSSEAFARKVADSIPEVLRPAICPLLELHARLQETIRHYDRLLGELAATRYPSAQHLQQVHGVGPVTAMAFVLTVADPARFATSGQVGSWVGLCPRHHASGDSDPQLPITKMGDGMLRRLLVQCGQYILGPFGKDSDLRRYGERLVARGGAGARKRAVVAVARKLAVLLHRLWANGLRYQPLHHAERVAT